VQRAPLALATLRVLLSAMLTALPFVDFYNACMFGAWFFFLLSVRLTLQERITGNTPDARITADMQAVLQGDEEAALAANEESTHGHDGALHQRRLGPGPLCPGSPPCGGGPEHGVCRSALQPVGVRLEGGRCWL
jgi:hypothetical protein